MFKYSQIENFEAVIARTLKSNSNNLLFRTSNSVGTKDVMALLDEADRSIMCCSECNEFLRKYSNLVYLDMSGEVRSALFRNLDFGADEERPDLVEFFALLAEIVEQGNIVDFSPETFRGMGGNAISIGNAELGGFTHFHGHIIAQPIPQDASFHETKSAISNISKKWKGLKTLFNIIDKIYEAFLEEPHVDDDAKNRLTCYHTILKEACKWDNCNSAKIAAILWSKNIHGLMQLYHMNGESLGAMFKMFQRDGDYESALSFWLGVNHPHRKKRRDQDRLNKQQLEAAKADLEDSGYLESLNFRVSTIEDLDALWLPTRPEEEAETTRTGADVLNELISEKSDEVEIPDVIWPSKATNISRGEFIDKIVPKAKRIFITLGNNVKTGTVITQLEGQKPLLFWQEPLNRNYVTIHFGEFAATRMFGVKPNDWNEVDAIIESPWYSKANKLTNQRGLSNSLQFVIETENDLKIDHLPSYGLGYVDEVAKHRGVMDAILSRTPVDCSSENRLFLFQLSKGMTFNSVRVELEDGARKLVNILDIE